MIAALVTVIGLSVVHSAANPVHYLPFVAMGKARGWSLATAAAAAALAAAWHMAGFLLIALLGMLAGKGIGALESVMHAGSDFGLWIFLAFGLAYAAYGIRRALGTHNGKRRPAKPQVLGHALSHVCRRPVRRNFVSCFFLLR